MKEYKITIETLTTVPENKYPDRKEVYTQIMIVTEEQEQVMIENIIKAVNSL